MVEQRSDEWRELRLGHLGASRLGDALAEGRNGQPSATREDLLYELLSERLSGKPYENFHSRYMEDGIENEPFARAEYEARTDAIVTEHPGKEWSVNRGFWASPDGLIGEVGGVEIKSPKTKNHLKTMATGVINTGYLYQMAGNILVFDREWWDFVSYDPALPDDLCIYIKRFYRDELPVDKVRDGILRFLDDLESLEREWKR